MDLNSSSIACCPAVQRGRPPGLHEFDFKAFDQEQRKRTSPAAERTLRCSGVTRESSR